MPLLCDEIWQHHSMSSAIIFAGHDYFYMMQQRLIYFSSLQKGD
jgi:hypothetical protein